MKSLSNLFSLSKGILVILALSAILLIADRHNRNVAEAVDVITPVIENPVPEPGREYRIAIAYFAPEEGFDNVMNGLLDGLRQLGFIPDSNLKVSTSHCNAEISNIPSMLMSLDNQNFDLIVPTSTPVIQGSFNSVKNTPVVFTYCFDPLGAGAGSSPTEHLPNITGVGSFPPVPETMDFIERLIPGIKTIGTIYNSSESNSISVMKVAREVLKKKGITLEEITVTNTNEVYQAAQVLVGKSIDLVWITGDNTAIQSFDAIVKNANKAGLPIVVNDQEMVARGAVAAIGIGWYSTGFHSAEMVARVLTGSKPDAIPIENFVETDVLINNNAAKLVNLTIPAELQRLADYGVEKLELSHKLRFALVAYNDAPITEASVAGILKGLGEVGLVRGSDYDITIQNAQGDLATLNNIIDDVADGRYDLIFITSTPTLQVVSKKIKNTPVVFTCVADPVAAGAGTSFQNHLPNITGISTMGDYKGGLKLFSELVPGMKTVATLYTPGEVNSVVNFKTLKDVGKSMGIEVNGVPVANSSDVADAALNLTASRPDAICQIIDNLTSASFGAIAKAGSKANIPVFGFVSSQAYDGAVAAIARDYVQGGKDAVKLAVKILTGTSPSTIPFRYVSRSQMVLNPAAAKRSGIRINDRLLKKADGIVGSPVKNK
ncbi:MAG TPA: hypothetical protein DEO70_14940 [Bacteroidales bacterium]|nr:MAG: hypothetical protein A2X11_09595 [Bacteroidetes bacterium GWE2_42_24]OFY27912.1 MAG: hypothetical protein A2X09_15265 [Bacteroidetes bacterium GWF2_43_11]HBZ68126.1 hypothetical protein [Bacteroidales bacterium]